MKRRQFLNEICRNRSETLCRYGFRIKNKKPQRNIRDLIDTTHDSRLYCLLADFRFLMRLISYRYVFDITDSLMRPTDIVCNVCEYTHILDYVYTYIHTHK